MAQQTRRMQDDYNWIAPIEVMLGSINHEEVRACSIFTVSDKLRNPKEEAYRPNAISIGPLHRAGSNLQAMEELKWRYVLTLLGRTGRSEEHALRLRNSATAMLDLDNVVRASYGGNVELEPHDLAKNMLVDGCFVLEFLFRLHERTQLHSVHFPDPIFENEDKLFSVLNDLTMLENQMPFIVLKKLYRKFFGSDNPIQNDHRVADLALGAFGYNLVHASGTAHLLHLIHLSTAKPENGEVKRVCQELQRCATKLRAAGITIRPPNRSNMDDNRFVDKFDFNINFQNRILEIPPLHIKETTEYNWRNLIAWEQGRIGIRSKFTSYALFFQSLICCEHDIEMLLKKQVIVNDTKRKKEDLLKLFCTIMEGVEHMDSSYSELCERLNHHPPENILKKLPIITWHKCRFILGIIQYYWQNWYHILIREHIPTVWKLIGVLAAMVLLVLAVMQTYYAAHSYK